MSSNLFRIRCKNFVTYVQGQCPEPRTREYFYFIDHQGMLFLDDARIKNFTSCFKEDKFTRHDIFFRHKHKPLYHILTKIEKQFLVFFFKRLRKNNTDRYFPDFPYISPCGREKNYIRCDDYPIVFTHVIKNEDDPSEMFCHSHAGDLLKVPFKPNMIYMCPESGRIYHPAPEKVGSVGLIQSKLAIEFSKLFTFNDVDLETEPTHFTWNGIKYELDQNWFHHATKSH